jgi:hypothetical protein
VTAAQLATGDPVAADATYMSVHLQRTSYLKSEECKVAEGERPGRTTAATTKRP